MSEFVYKIINRAYHKFLVNRLVEYSTIDLTEIKKTIDAQAELIFAHNRDLVVDNAGHLHIKIASLIQASYLVLSKEIDNKASIIEILKFALIEAFRKYLSLPFSIALNISKSNFIKLLNRLPTETVNNLIFGRGFSVTTTVRDADLHEFIYSSCLYNEFFRRNLTPELTEIICYADHAWIDVIDHEKHSLKFERPSTLANGQDKCVFKLIKLNKQR